MAIVGIPQAFSGSQGGEPIQITANAFPGQVVHANAADHVLTDVIEAIVAVNPNPEQIPLYWWIAGPGLTPPTIVNQAQRVDIPPTNEGREPTPLITPLVLKPGYEVRMMVPRYGTPLGQEAMTIQGEVTHYEVTDPQLVYGPGYGGLLTLSEQTIGTIAAGSWVTIPFQQGLLNNPVNVDQDAVNNRFRINAQGIWFISFYGLISLTKENNDRYAYWRFFNETLNSPISSFPYPIPIENGNNFSQWSVGILSEVTTVGEWLRLEIGDGRLAGGTTTQLDGVNLPKAGVSVYKIAELPESLGGAGNPV